MAQLSTTAYPDVLSVLVHYFIATDKLPFHVCPFQHMPGMPRISHTVTTSDDSLPSSSMYTVYYLRAQTSSSAEGKVHAGDFMSCMTSAPRNGIMKRLRRGPPQCRSMPASTARARFFLRTFSTARKYKRRYPAALTETISGKWPSAAQRCAETVWVALRAGAVMMECRGLHAWERQHNNCVGRRPAEVSDKGP